MIKDKFQKNYFKLNNFIENHNNLYLELIQGPLTIPSRKFKCICSKF